MVFVGASNPLEPSILPRGSDHLAVVSVDQAMTDTGSTTTNIV